MTTPVLPSFSRTLKLLESLIHLAMVLLEETVEVEQKKSHHNSVSLCLSDAIASPQVPPKMQAKHQLCQMQVKCNVFVNITFIINSIIRSVY